MSQDDLSVTFAALADPTRRAILEQLASGETSVTDLAKPFAMSLPAISRHLKVLERAGLIVRGKEAQWRPCRLEATPLKEVADYLEPYRRLWEENFQRLDALLTELQSSQPDPENTLSQETLPPLFLGEGRGGGHKEKEP